MLVLLHSALYSETNQTLSLDVSKALGLRLQFQTDFSLRSQLFLACSFPYSLYGGIYIHGLLFRFCPLPLSHFETNNGRTIRKFYWIFNHTYTILSLNLRLFLDYILWQQVNSWNFITFGIRIFAPITFHCKQRLDFDAIRLYIKSTFVLCYTLNYYGHQNV